MTRRTAQILTGVIGISGLIHISGLLNNWDYDFYVGLVMIIMTGLWFTSDFFKNGKSFSTKNYLVIERQQIKWWRLKELIGIMTLFFLLIYNGGQMDSILITLILYFSLMVLLDHKSHLEITDKCIIDDGERINFNSTQSMDIQQNQIIIRDTDDFIWERRVSLEGIDLDDKELIKKRFIKGDATAANTGI